MMMLRFVRTTERAATAYRASLTAGARYPVYVAFSIEIPVILHRWHENSTLFGSVAIVAALILLLISGLVLRGMKEERASFRRRSVTLSQLLTTGRLAQPDLQVSMAPVQPANQHRPRRADRRSDRGSR
jgi:hypothetical protein